ncbi:MraZ protein [Thermodesulfovibrio aggregans]|uniref:Transcriptional regulator MraZ n=2 Tax=Thermodesulfovibrio aggregans TaxID=86166 RepID=A0A0U9HT48_9BACT|nr:MraZ protein [Thermodesulfovibrio aggregans]
MISFIGKYYHNLDQKGRVILPSSIREVLANKYSSGKLYLTTAPFDKALHLYPLEEWIKLEDKIRQLPKSDESVIYFLRRVIASATPCEMDKQGRILIPYEYRKDAGINSEVVIVGQIDRVEIWDKDTWDSVTDPSKVDIKRIQDGLAKYGL